MPSRIHTYIMLFVVLFHILLQPAPCEIDALFHAIRDGRLLRPAFDETDLVGEIACTFGGCDSGTLGKAVETLWRLHHEYGATRMQRLRCLCACRALLRHNASVSHQTLRDVLIACVSTDGIDDRVVIEVIARLSRRERKDLFADGMALASLQAIKRGDTAALSTLLRWGDDVNLRENPYFVLVNVMARMQDRSSAQRETNSHLMQNMLSRIDNGALSITSELAKMFFLMVRQDLVNEQTCMQFIRKFRDWHTIDHDVGTYTAMSGATLPIAVMWELVYHGAQCCDDAPFIAPLVRDVDSGSVNASMQRSWDCDKVYRYIMTALSRGQYSVCNYLLRKYWLPRISLDTSCTQLLPNILHEMITHYGLYGVSWKHMAEDHGMAKQLNPMMQHVASVYTKNANTSVYQPVIVHVRDHMLSARPGVPAGIAYMMWYYPHLCSNARDEHGYTIAERVAPYSDMIGLAARAASIIGPYTQVAYDPCIWQDAVPFVRRMHRAQHVCRMFSRYPRRNKVMQRTHSYITGSELTHAPRIPDPYVAAHIAEFEPIDTYKPKRPPKNASEMMSRALNVVPL